MRFIKARTAQGPRIGVLRADGVVAIGPTEATLERFYGDDGSALQRLGEDILAAPATEVPFPSIELLAPVTPPSMRDFMVFEEHVAPAWRAAGMTRGPDVWYQQPIGYFSNAANLRGPREAMEIPGDSLRLDYELEVGAIVGREATSVGIDSAAGCIAGFLILCDWSARDIQFREMEGRLGPFKGKDFGSSLGPVFITPDEIAHRRKGNGYDLLMTSAVNDRTYGTDHWSSAYWSFEELISYSSWNSRVEPGALIGSGTCQGGCIVELSTRNGGDDFPYLRAGDEVTLSIETMENIRAPILGPTRGAWPGYKDPPAPNSSANPTPAAPAATS